MSAISGTRRAFKELVDGSIRVQIDIDPRFKKEFLQTFGAIDMPVAIAPLVADFERIEQKEQKGGALSRLAGMWCKDEEFREWLSDRFVFVGQIETEAEAADAIRGLLEIDSRKEIDSNPEVSEKFLNTIRAPYMEWMKKRQ